MRGGPGTVTMCCSMHLMWQRAFCIRAGVLCIRGEYTSKRYDNVLYICEEPLRDAKSEVSTSASRVLHGSDACPYLAYVLNFQAHPFTESGMYESHHPPAAFCLSFVLWFEGVEYCRLYMCGQRKSLLRRHRQRCRDDLNLCGLSILKTVPT
jgi:hypothetical protein